MKIFVHCHGEVSGPFSRFEIFAGLQKGVFTNEDAACVEGSDEWKPLQQLLTGKLGVGGKKPAVHSPDLGVPAVPEPAATRILPEPILPELMPWTGDSPPLPTFVRKPQDVQTEPSTNRFKDLATICAAVGLLLFMAAGLALVIGRTRFLHRANIVAIETSQISSGQRATSSPLLAASMASVAPHPDIHEPADPVVLGQVAAPTPEQASQVSAAFTTEAKDVASPRLNEVPANTSATPHVGSSDGFSPGNEQRTASGRSGEKKLFETPRITPRELIDVLAERFAATPVNAAGSVSKPDPNITLREGSFVLDTGLAWNPHVEVVYTIPMYKNSTVGPRASNIMMWGDWPGGMAPPEEEMVNGKLVCKKSGLYNWLGYYARELGYTAFSMHCVTRSWNDPQETYFLAGQQWVDLVFRAQDELTRRFKLAPRKLMITGASLGASFAERIAAARPDKVAAVALMNAPEVSLPKQPSDTVWYMQINRGDSMQAQYNMLYNALLNQNAKVLFDIFPPDYGWRGISGNMYHGESALDIEANRSFLDGVASQRDASGNIDPANWPFVRDQDHPYLVLSRNSPDLHRIAPTKRVFLPSAAMAHCLQSLPVPIQVLLLPQPDGSHVKCFVGLPPLGRPRGVLVYAPEASYKGITNMFNDVYFLAGKGYLVLCPYTTQSEGKTLASTMKFVQGIPLLKELPVMLVGVGERATQLWQEISKSSLSPGAMVLLKFKPRDLFDESKLTMGSHPIRFPVLFVEDEAQLLNVSTTTEAKENLAAAHQIDAYIAKCRERHQISRVIQIPASADSEERNAQKIVEVVNDSFADLVEGHRGTIIK